MDQTETDQYELLLKNSPALRRIIAESVGDKPAARAAALEEFSMLLYQAVGIEAADKLAEKYSFTPEEITDYATQAVQILHKAGAHEPKVLEYAEQVQKHYDL